MKRFTLMVLAAGLGFVAFYPALAAAGNNAPAVAPADKQVELDDGTKLSIEGSMVYVVAVDGTKTSLPDGDYTTKEGAAIVVKDGALVK